ncbi:hypothetical protein [Microbacterium sp. VKM Ac-2923]|uniref:hypothetical protein n=1 Tax=Microbacterium sp. VKM Ac-2923 TaxID=2929476 RepID=UPI001FB42104|nr:hypothetical protein [Microbacterium sp. VKM Ac-2923]MCJ1709551.1 hypothetical protein [Microbacterium sp. VKM Ac-2923]
MEKIPPTTFVRAAAWVPDDHDRPWEEAANLASEWIWQRSQEEETLPLLVTSTLQNGRDIQSLVEIAVTCGHATPRGKQRFIVGPVIAYLPDARTLDLATGLAYMHSLVVVETARFPLLDWATGAGAVNLLDMQSTTSVTAEKFK